MSEPRPLPSSETRSPAPGAGRRPDLDWLRVVCVQILIAFHVGMFFVPWDWHLKNPVLLPALELPMSALHATRMPLLMLIAGIGTALALGKRTLGAFARDRLARLGLPILLGLFVIVPPQVYLERIFKGQFQGSFLAWYPSVLRLVPYPAGDLSWHHLWFVAYLLAYCLLALPLLGWLSVPQGQALLQRLDRWLSKAPLLWLLFVPIAVERYLLRRFDETHALFNDPKLLLQYGLLFCYGHLLGRLRGPWEPMVRLRRLWLGLAVVLGVLAVPDWHLPASAPLFPQFLLSHAFAWSTLLAALGLARANITARPAWLARAQEVAFPLYIWHQTVILVLAYGLLRWDPALGAWSRFGLLLLGSTALSWLLALLVARVGPLRPWFGLAPFPRPEPVVRRRYPEEPAEA
jgi:hypothetical protein